jgi:hypothetical protein
MAFMKGNYDEVKVNINLERIIRGALLPQLTMLSGSGVFNIFKCAVKRA